MGTPSVTSTNSSAPLGQPLSVEAGKGDDTRFADKLRAIDQPRRVEAGLTTNVVPTTPVPGAAQLIYGSRSANPGVPDAQTGRDLSVRTSIPGGGSVQTTILNVQTPLNAPETGSTPVQDYRGPRMDVRIIGDDGKPTAAVRLDGNGAISGAARILGNGTSTDTNVVVTGRFNPTVKNGQDVDPTGASVGVQVTSGNVGGRGSIINPAGAPNNNGTPGAQTKRGEVFVAPDGSAPINSSNLGPGTELGIYVEQQDRPASNASSNEVGAFGRFNAITNPTFKGNLTINGGVRNTSTNAGDAQSSALSGSFNLTIGEPGASTFTVQGSGTTTSATGGDDLRLYGNVKVPFRE